MRGLYGYHSDHPGGKFRRSTRQIPHFSHGDFLVRPGKSIELCKPYNVPKKWVTRKSYFECNFNVSGTSDLSKATEALMEWVSWSPGYAEGVGINGHEVIKREGATYVYYHHQVSTPAVYLKPGVNAAFTGKTPLYDGQMVHGMEVNWPGIMVLIQYY